MSQHLQFRDGTSDTYNFPVQDSPTVGRTIPQSSAGSSQGSPSSLSDTGYRYVVAGVQDSPPLLLTTHLDRTHHKTTPSPLQTSTSANPNHATTTPTKSGFSRPSVEEQSRTVETVRYMSRRGDEPRSPKERLDDLLASEKSFYDSEDAPASPTSSGGRPRYTILPVVPPLTATNCLLDLYTPRPHRMLPREVSPTQPPRRS